MKLILKRYLHMALGSENINLIWLNFQNYPNKICGICEVAVMHEEINIPVIKAVLFILFPGYLI